MRVRVAPRHAVGWLKEIRSLSLGWGRSGEWSLALTGYWGGELVYTYGFGVKSATSPVTV